jgi:hypothetical protein
MLVPQQHSAAFLLLLLVLPNGSPLQYIAHMMPDPYLDGTVGITKAASTAFNRLFFLKALPDVYSNPPLLYSFDPVTGALSYNLLDIYRQTSSQPLQYPVGPLPDQLRGGLWLACSYSDPKLQDLQLLFVDPSLSLVNRAFLNSTTPAKPLALGWLGSYILVLTGDMRLLLFDPHTMQVKTLPPLYLSYVALVRLFLILFRCNHHVNATH